MRKIVIVLDEQDAQQLISQCDPRARMGLDAWRPFWYRIMQAVQCGTTINLTSPNVSNAAQDRQNGHH